MGNFRGWEWILILLLALLLFGGFKKLPDAARGIGRSLRIFKAETKGLHDDDDSQPAESTAEQAGDADAAATPSAIESVDDASTVAAGPGEETPQAHPVSTNTGNSSSTTGSGSSDSRTS